LRALPETEAPDFFGIQMSNGTASGRVRGEPKRAPGSRVAGSRRQRIAKLLADVEKRLNVDENKVTLGDFIRLMQLDRELEEEEQPREIIVTWKDPAEKGCELK
jgi:hypothetical protein